MPRHGPLLCRSLVILLLLSVLNPARGQLLQQVEIPSSPNPVGSGARALGMGGAFIAVADDATAASWNPGGLVQLERPEISVVGECVYRTEDNSFGTNPEASGEQRTSEAKFNYLSAAYPFTLLNRNMIVSLNYQHLFDFSRDWHFTVADDRVHVTRDFRQIGGLYAYGLAYSLQILPQLSMGFTLNLWEDGPYTNGWTQQTKDSGIFLSASGRPVNFSAITTDRFSFSGFNTNVGLLWNVTGKWNVGLVFKSPFTADLKHRFRDTEAIEFMGITSRDTMGLVENEKLDMPMSYGIGLSYRFSDRLTVSGDVYHTQWQDFVLTDSQGNKTSPLSGKPAGQANIASTTQVRVGAEYLFIQPKYTVPLRAGFFYDPAPAEGSPDTFLGFSLGTGIGIGRFIFDIAYQYRFGRDVGESLLPALRFSQDVDEHTVYSSLIIHF